MLGALGDCFVLICIFLCPCMKHRRKAKNKDICIKELTSTSMSTSVDENSFGVSFSASSSHSLTSRQEASKSCQGRTFTLVELNKATSNFSPSYKIGQGGFGIVYKGKLKDGTIVAIKKAKKGVHVSRVSSEFENEVDILLNVDHLNLVKLIGYVEESSERFLVTEYIPNGNLREHLDCEHGVVLDLSTRLDICIDVAHALTYLHLYAEKPIIHRDVKSSNILLTENFRAKVADFGYSRVGPLELGDTHVSTQVKGTAGYLDPEYLRTYRLNERSDVYSFGVLLVEVITGRRPIEQLREMKEKITLRWAFRLFLDQKFSEVLDPRLKGTPATYLVEQKLLELAFQCSAPTKQERPNMKRVVEILWGIRKDYQNVLQEMKLTGSLYEGIDRSDSMKLSRHFNMENSDTQIS
eukprot:c27151_g1_i1 orf=672-1901(-)